jgi:hypothetical protein
MASRRIDPLGKGMAQMLLDLPLPIPRALAQRLQADRPMRDGM